MTDLESAIVAELTREFFAYVQAERQGETVDDGNLDGLDMVPPLEIALELQALAQSAPLPPPAGVWQHPSPR